MERPKSARSLAATLALAFFILTMVALFISHGVRLFFSLRIQQIAVSNSQQLIAQDAARTVRRFIVEKFYNLETAIWLNDLVQLPQSERVRLIESLLGFHQAFRQIVLLGPQGQELVHSSRLSRGASRNLVKQITGNVMYETQQKKRYVSETYLDPTTGEPLVIIAVPVINVLGEFKGVLAAELNLKFMWDLVDQLKTGKEGRVYVVDKRGNLIAFYDAARVLKGENVRHLAAVNEFVNSPGSSKAHTVSAYAGIMGTTVIGTYFPLQAPDWAVVIELPWYEAYRNVIDEIVFSTAITLIMALLAGLLGIFMARRLAAPMVNLMETATRVAGGERKLQAPVTGPVEAVGLATAFNNMTTQLRTTMESLEEQVEEVRRTEQELSQSRNMLAHVLDSIPQSVFWKDRDSVFLGCNKVFAKAAGFDSPQEIIGKNDFDLPWPREESEAYRADDREVIENNVAKLHIIEPLQQVDGTRLWIDTTKVPLVDKTGQIYGVLGVYEDITDKKEAEEALRESESRFKTLADAAFEGIVFSEKGIIIDVNNQLAVMLGYPREELIGKPLLELVAPEYREVVAENQRTGLLAFHDHLLLRKDGSKVPVESRARSVQSGDRLLRISALFDISERKQAQKELFEKTEELNRFFTVALDLLCIADTEGRFRHLNPQWEVVLGYSLEELEGKRFLDFVHPDDLASTEAALAKLAAQKVVLDFVNRYQRKDGSYRWIEWRSYPAGELVYAAARDITERKATEEKIRRINEELELRVDERTAQLEAANKELEAFTYSVSHDLRAPLRAIDGYTSILDEDYGQDFDEEGRRVCKIIHDNTRRMGQLIDDLLAFSRLSRTDMQPAVIDMGTMAHSLFHELTTPEARERIDFRVDLLPPATGDPVLMRQALTNLISNAIKFSSKRERALIEVGSMESNGETAYFVRDNGAGFDMQYVGKLFGVFQRLHSEREFEGTGVGLAIVQRVIRRHGGRVWAEGVADKGAAFFFTVPVKGDRYEPL